MIKHEKILKFIKEVNAANLVMRDIFLYGSCLNFNRMLNVFFPESECFFNQDHVITKIEGKYYDISGEIELEEVLEKRYTLIHDIYFDKYKTEDSLNSGDMYDIRHKTKYLRDWSSYTGLQSDCCEAPIETKKDTTGIKAFYKCECCEKICKVT